jgi:hypothetical protein
MSPWIWIPLALVMLAVLLLVWGLLHLRGSVAAAKRAIATVTLDRIDALARECEQGFRDKFGDTLDLADLEASATCLSARVDESTALKAAFAKPDLYWHFVLPVGAYVGELLRVHAGAVWKVSEEGGVEMAITTADGEVATFPFDKVIKQSTVGDRGDLYAYLTTAPTLGNIVRELAAAELGAVP